MHNSDKSRKSNVKHPNVCGCVPGPPMSIDAYQMLQCLGVHLLMGLLVWFLTPLLWFLVVALTWCGLCYAFTVMSTVCILFMGSSSVTRHGCWSMQLSILWAVLESDLSAFGLHLPSLSLLLFFDLWLDNWWSFELFSLCTSFGPLHFGKCFCICCVEDAANFRHLQQEKLLQYWHITMWFRNA